MRSIKGIRSKMIDKKGLNEMPEESKVNTLQDLKKLVDQMYTVRNSTTGTTCLGHTHKSYAAFQGSIGKSENAMSVGDFDRALDNMPSCTCDSRSSQSCVCVSVQFSYCSCNSVMSCDCVSRSPGKYGSDSSYATDDYYSGVDCSCNMRCTCNTVREFY